MVKHRFIRTLVAGPLLLLSAAPLAACGHGSPAANAVAALSSSATASASPTASQSAYQRGLAYSACMRQHGITDFPDPVDVGNGQVGWRMSPGIDSNSAQYKAADKACSSLAQAGSSHKFDPTKIPAWAACVRAHGVPKFPDPVNNGTGMDVDVTVSAEKLASKPS